MKRKAIIIMTAAFLAGSGLFAQDVNDVLRYSQIFYTGTARFMSMGGAFTALGGDMSTFSQNPAGIGLFRSSEISFTPQLFYIRTTSNAPGLSKDYLYNFNVGQIGIVSRLLSSANTSGLISLNVGYSFNKTSNLNSSIRIEGINNSSSMADSWADQSFGYTRNELLDNAPFGYMASKVFLIDTLSGSNTEYGTVYSQYGDNPPSKYGQTMRRTISNTGYTGEHAFSIGGNYSNKIFFGATLGINTLRFSDRYQHLEKVDYTLASGFKDFMYTQYTENQGTGISFKLGAIVKPVESVRVGLAFQSPIYYRIHAYLTDDITANFEGFPTDEYSLQPLRYNYALSTPFRALAGVAIQIKKIALLSADYEFVDYSTARFSQTGDNYDYTEKNLAIKNTLKPTSNIRVGGEFRLNKMYFRGGYGYYGKAYKLGELNDNLDYSSFSLGLGFREQNLNIDLGYSNTGNSESYILYNIYSATAPNNLESVTSNLNIRKNLFAVTVGYKFGY